MFTHSTFFFAIVLPCPVLFFAISTAVAPKTAIFLPVFIVLHYVAMHSKKVCSVSTLASSQNVGDKWLLVFTLSCGSE